MFDRWRPRRSKAEGSAFATATTHAATIRSNCSSRCLAVSCLESRMPVRVEPGGHDHGGRDERTRQRPPSGLIGAGDTTEPLGAQRGLVALEVCRDSRYSHPHLEGGNTITNAFPITASSGTKPTPTGGSKRESPEWARLSPSTNSMPSGTVVGG